MTLLAILLGLSIEKLLPGLLQYRRYDWIDGFQTWVRSKAASISHWNDTFSLVVVVLLPILLTAFVHYRLFHWAAIFGFVFSVIVLAYTLGPGGIFKFIQQAEDLSERQDTAQLRLMATHLLKGELPASEADICKAVKSKILLETNSSVTAVMFWFAVLGPMGALLYRVSQVIMISQADKDNLEYRQAANILFAMLNWIPSHLTALCYGITGSFVDALHQWKLSSVKNHLNNSQIDTMLVDVGIAALQHSEKEETNSLPGVSSVISLAKRSAILWLTLLALLTMAGWAG